jgi:hypothetical protein
VRTSEEVRTWWPLEIYLVVSQQELVMCYGLACDVSDEALPFMTVLR